MSTKNLEDIIAEERRLHLEAVSRAHDSMRLAAAYLQKLQEAERKLDACTCNRQVRAERITPEQVKQLVEDIKDARVGLNKRLSMMIVNPLAKAPF